METYSSTINFVALLMFLSFLFFLFGKWRKSEQQELPPGPWRLPLIGSIHHLRGAFPHRTLRKLARKYGPIMYFQLGEIPAVVISSPNVAKEVLKIHEHAFAAKPQLTSINIITYNGKDIAFAPYGDNWRQMRNLCVTELLSAKMVKSFSSIRNDEILSLVSSVHSMNGSVVNITEKILRFTNSVTCRSTFGKVDKYQDELINLLREVLDSLGGFDVADLFPSWKLLHKTSGVKSRLLKLHQKVDEALENIINEHIMNRALGSKGNGEFGGEDLVDVLLRIKETGELQFPITNDHIKAVISDMFAAGTETSAAVITWVLSEMMRNPKIMAKAQSEVRQVFKGKTSFDEKDLDKLSYLKLVIKETLRLHPPSPFLPRQCMKQTYIGGYKVPPKTRVLINSWALGRDPESWHDPESFIPERFENSSVDFMGNHFQLIPFGAGKRICPGMQFGLANVKHPLARLLYHFNWALPYGTSPEDLIEKDGLSAAKQKDLCLIAIDYRSDEFF
ncbi:PREDICTED: premnaspirodiene oxygenase-like [Nicotiana attenuata]|uniref:Cytochrome p450 71d7 n=1 Tax=Nicotiana attenuata TaxID=49451 RepID=A0A1J6IC59_NICAT|nr:PREDICTED: premnaspirodiene oxygenase-like [Nicotiana attenuata]OIT02518.1 cytochrome p450 71d7 [Nicotiana attenuata]